MVACSVEKNDARHEVIDAEGAKFFTGYMPPVNFAEVASYFPVGIPLAERNLSRVG
jgi:hypothetical protein